MNITIKKTKWTYKGSKFLCFSAIQVVDGSTVEIGSLTIFSDAGKFFVKHVEVDGLHRNKGIATKLYKEAINDLGSLSSRHNSRTDIPDKIWKSLARKNTKTITEEYITIYKNK